MNKIEFEVQPGMTTGLMCDVGTNDGETETVIILVRSKHRSQSCPISVIEEVPGLEIKVREQIFVHHCDDSIDFLLEAMDHSVSDEFSDLVNKRSLDGEYIVLSHCTGPLLNPMVMITEDASAFPNVLGEYQDESRAFDILNKEV